MGNHASLDELRELEPEGGRPTARLRSAGLPRRSRTACRTCSNRLAVRAFNELWYRKTPKHHHGTESLTGFFHPLDMVGQWTRLYGSHGFLQYQFVVPFEAVDTMRTIVAKIADEGHASFLAVLKRFGAESRAGCSASPNPVGPSRSTCRPAWPASDGC